MAWYSMFVNIVLQVLRMISWMFKHFQMILTKFRKKLQRLLLLLLLLELLNLDPLAAKTRLLLNSPKNLRWLFTRVKILFKMLHWSRYVKIFLKARTPLPLLLPSTKALVRHITVNY
jgi:hypothetical protein